jgi:hypothetical protein
MAKQEASTRSNFGVTSSLRNGEVTVTKVNPDGSLSVERIPAGQAPTPKKPGK